MRNVEVSYFDLIQRTVNAISENAVTTSRYSRCVTFQVTNGCNLNCSYCYQIHKGHNNMSIETGEKLVEMLYEMYDANDPDGFINQETQNLQIDFIGGEPFLNIDTIDAICDKFFEIGIAKKHPWITSVRFAVSSNGTLYFNPKVQEFLKKYHNFLSLNITLDGPEEFHDICRKDFDGNGSFKKALAAVEDYRKNYGKIDSTKITISENNLPHLSSIIDFVKEQHFTNIAANPIAERYWTLDDAKMYYQQLKMIADNLLKENDADVAITLFSSKDFKPLKTTDSENWCGGTGKMLAFDPDGVMYPCIRYMESSLGSDQPPVIIGNLTDGLYQTSESKKIKEEFSQITRQSQSSKECIHCSIASGCAWCSAWNYQETGSSNKRSTSICLMHQARSLANCYFWNMLYAMEGREKRMPLYLNQEKALRIISKDEYNMLLELTENERR